MATPAAAGAFAVMKAENPGMSIPSILRRFQETGAQVTDDRYTRSFVTAPRLQLDEAISGGTSDCEGDACWVLGNQGESCNAVCRRYDKVCEQDMLKSINTPAKVSQLAVDNGVSCSSTRNWSYGSNPGVCTDSSCCGGSCVNACTYGTGVSQTCSAVAWTYSRLCPCAVEDATPGYCVGNLCWIMGDQGEDCNSVCSAHDRTCNPAMLDDIDTPLKVSQIAIANGTSCSSTRAWSYNSNPGMCTRSTCCGGSCVNACAYGTGVAQSCTIKNPAYSRFCPCER